MIIPQTGIQKKGSGGGGGYATDSPPPTSNCIPNENKVGYIVNFFFFHFDLVFLK